MSLRLKTILILLILIVVLVLMLVSMSQFVLRPSYRNLEQTYLQKDKERVQAQLLHEQTNLAQYARDWASWDDTYRFVVDQNEAYAESNLVSSTFANNDLSLFLLVNEARELVYAGFYEADHGRVLTTPSAELAEFLYEPGTTLLRPQLTEAPQIGLYRLANQWLILTQQPIRDSADVLPPRGTLLMARLVDEPFLDKITQNAGVSMNLLPLPQVAEQMPELLAQLAAVDGATEGEPPLVMVTEAEAVHSYDFLRDPQGNPIAVLQVSNDRIIYEHGENSLETYLFLTINMGLFIIFIMGVILTTQVVTPAEKLQRGVLYIRQTSDFRHRLPDQGEDELAKLGAEINHLLQTLVQTLDLQRLTENALRTEQQKLEERVQERTEALAEANARLRQLDASKTQFINDVSHEFRTPVTSLNLYFDLWQRGNPTQQERYLRVIGEQIQRIVNLTDSVMRLAHIEFPSHEPTPAPILLTELWAGLGVKYGETALAKGLQLQLSCDPKLKLVGYPELLATMFEELLENSLNYSEQGCVVLVARPCSPPAPCIHIELTDQGIGIPPEELPFVTERFYRGTGASQSNRPGIGVGLTMVKHIVALHGGEWEIKSAVGEGTAVTITLPLTPPPLAPNQIAS
jgi:signal transduction histidine kinase